MRGDESDSNRDCRHMQMIIVTHANDYCVKERARTSNDHLLLMCDLLLMSPRTTRKCARCRLQCTDAACRRNPRSLEVTLEDDAAGLLH